ncbi:putative Ribosome biogenesis protein BRX1 [Paratrimastix pyriformis]|uniref:Ribosome biogenesis protein BRX1 n=1 Tax=Paratrimastix pyriformis TaxID=342808 RepID=A0ABQ8USL6_9EUKA|nr:putative Ribosome biogenesis protein BRX1 [Paratrimastix pyriformis]
MVKGTKKKILTFSSRGIGARYRHLLTDLQRLLPHSRKEAKLEPKEKLTTINEICELRSCEGCIFFEVRKRTDLYMWLSLTPNGPSAKFQVYNVHTMEELKMTGNCMLNSRPIITFDGNFDTAPHYTLMKELLLRLFGVPKGQPRTQPYVDHVFSFSIADEKIWFRHFQIADAPQAGAAAPAAGGSLDGTMLVEIGPRFVLDPIRVFNGSFGGFTMWRNPHYVSPTQVRMAPAQCTAPPLLLCATSHIRAADRAALAMKYVSRVRSIKEHQQRREESKLRPEPLDMEEVFQ